jgi:hypothetical protein
MCNMNSYGFPCSRPKGAKRVHGFQTGDMVLAIVPRGKSAGRHVGRIVVRTKGTFELGDNKYANWKHCRLVQHGDGYSYEL